MSQPKRESADQLWALVYDFANQAGICERSAEWHAAEPCETCQGLVNFARRAAPLTEPVNWKASYEQACEDADAYKIDAEARVTKATQNWRSCQHEISYLRAALAEYKKELSSAWNVRESPTNAESDRRRTDEPAS